MSKSKKLSNPFSTGGGGFHFETHIQASFVVLMLSNGYAPCLPCWPIVEIKLQGKIDGYATDDLIIVVEDVDSKERRKLLGQVKHSITFTKSNKYLGEVLQAAWCDYKNPKVFKKGKDIIALITGHLSAKDARAIQWLLEQAMCTKDANEFTRHVLTANYGPSGCEQKFEVIRHYLKLANDGEEVSGTEMHEFLKAFHVLEYDLGNEFGVVLSLLHSHISQVHRGEPRMIWSRIVDHVQTYNQNAGAITLNNIPDDIRDVFGPRQQERMPEAFKYEEEFNTDWAQDPDAFYLSVAVLIGSWNEHNQNDLEVVTQLLGITYQEWQNKSRAILRSPDSPLSLKNGTWVVKDRMRFWNIVGAQVFDQNIDLFKSFAVSVLREPDPAFELSVDERWAAGTYGKMQKYSQALRRGMSEGLALLGSNPDACTRCSHRKTEITCIQALGEIFCEADWVLWGSLDEVLPILAEASPREFISSVEEALRQTPSPFDELFSQEGGGLTGRNYLTGLLWALEGLAWDESLLARVCLVLAELASHDPGGQWANRPLNSLTGIFLPWLPQTLASIEKRATAVGSIQQEWPDVAWELIIQLLPNQHQMTSGSHKPEWLRVVPEDWKEGVTHQEYWQQVSFFAESAVDIAQEDTSKLPELIDHFANLPKSAFDRLIQALLSEPVLRLPEEQRLPIWNHLLELTKKHRRFSEAEWSMPEEKLARIDLAVERLIPLDLIHLHQHLFSSHDHDLFEKNSDWSEQQINLGVKRDAAVLEIFTQLGGESALRLAEAVTFPDKVGHSLASIDNPEIDALLLPACLGRSDEQYKKLTCGFIWRRYKEKGHEWLDAIDITEWTLKQRGELLAYLPFTKEVWERASVWLQADESAYWSQVNPLLDRDDEDVSFVVEKLIEHGRPHAAIGCLWFAQLREQNIDIDQCVRALRQALSSSEPEHAVSAHRITELIQFLQKSPSINRDVLAEIEWGYLPLLEHREGSGPHTLEERLASSPALFCQMIQLAFRSENEDSTTKKATTRTSEAVATNAWRLLYGWKTPPGIQNDSSFSGEHFDKWLKDVVAACTESGHLGVALSVIGQVLFYAPADPDGLWMHRSIARVLNGRDASDLRVGFKSGVVNSRGVVWVDPSGAPERELAREFLSKAEEIEIAGFPRFAETLREMASFYDNEASAVIERNKDAVSN